MYSFLITDFSSKKRVPRRSAAIAFDDLPLRVDCRKKNFVLFINDKIIERAEKRVYIEKWGANSPVVRDSITPSIY